MSQKLKPYHIAIITTVGLFLVLGVSLMASANADSPRPITGISLQPIKQTKPTPATNGTAPIPAPTVAATPVTTPAPSPKVAPKPAAPPVTPAVASTIPKTIPLYAAPASSQIITNAAAAARSTDASVLNRLASKPTAVWFGDWSGDIRSAVNAYVSSAQSAGRLPVLVAYNIPNRDCNGQSAGGAPSAAAYTAWIMAFAAGIGGRQAMVIVEPDAVAANCFDATRAGLLSAAVKSLQNAGATVYLDAGNATWRSASDMASRLTQAGIANATGFSLNVSNYQTTAANTSFGSSLSKLIGSKHFVIDTSRNGNGPNATNDWCNPDGRALGSEPTLQTGNSLVDALLWVKVPGESDGACGPSQNGINPPAAGTFWPAYALMLARNAGW